AKELNVSADEVMEMDRRLSGGDTPLEGHTEDGEEVAGPIASLAAEDADPAEIVAQAQETRVNQQRMAAALASLDERSRDILMARWLQDEDGQTPTLHDLAARYGISAERVRQIEANALKKIKIALTA
ncbi:MAG: sigma-70 family RNA polymerase sigma factor, partial [Burkholderiaceae bacterium]